MKACLTSVVAVLILASALSLHLASCQSDSSALPRCIEGCQCTISQNGAGLDVNCSRRRLTEIKNIFDVLTEVHPSLTVSL